MNPRLVDVADDQNKIGFFVQFDEPRPILVINSESAKPFVHAFELKMVKGFA
jgi:hypothetical protein